MDLTPMDTYLKYVPLACLDGDLKSALTLMNFDISLLAIRYALKNKNKRAL